MTTKKYLAAEKRSRKANMSEEQLAKIKAKNAAKKVRQTSQSPSQCCSRTA